jgi:hypothetical protein
MNSTTSRDLVLGAAVGYKAHHVRVFAQSLQRAGYRGRTVLITGELPAAETDQMAAWGVETVSLSKFPGAYSRGVALKLMAPRARPLRKLYHLIRYTPLPRRTRYQLLSRIGVNYHHAMLNRYMLYWDILDQLQGVERVLLSDVRDVFFQSNPFDETWGEGLNVSLEDGRGSIGAGEFGITDTKYDHTTASGVKLRGVNASWIRKTYGERMVERIASKPICCAGVTFGSKSAVMRYLSKMVTEIARLTPVINEGMGYDQGIHNVLLHSGALDPVTIHANGDGPVYTVHSVPEHELPLDSENRLVRRDGKPVAIIHQYDRSPRLNAVLAA